MILTFTKEQHLKKAAENEIFAKAINLSASNDFAWRVTVTFYTAVHYIQAYLASQGKYPILHTARDSAIQKDQKIKGIFIDYRDLKDKSREARYECCEINQQDVDDMDECLSAIKGDHPEALGNEVMRSKFPMKPLTKARHR